MDRQKTLSRDTMSVITDFLTYDDVMNFVRSNVIAFDKTQYEIMIERQKIVQEQKHKEFIDWWMEYRNSRNPV